MIRTLFILFFIFSSMSRDAIMHDHSGIMNGTRADHVLLQNSDVVVPIHGHVLCKK